MTEELQFPTIAEAARRIEAGTLSPVAERPALDESQLAYLYQAAPEAFAMTDRLRRPLAWSDEPANTFCVPTRAAE